MALLVYIKLEMHFCIDLNSPFNVWGEEWNVDEKLEISTTLRILRKSSHPTGLQLVRQIADQIPVSSFPPLRGR